jgi:hypothetical protein
MSKYKIDWLRFVTEYLPYVLRTNIVAFAYVLLKPIRQIWGGVTTHITETDKILSYNSQYPNFQRLLNDLYDETLRRIKVYDGHAADKFLIAYPNSELKPIHIGFVVVKPMSEYKSYVGFIIKLPATFETDNDMVKKIRRTVDNYKLVGTNYKIIFN